jgi:hypothetical protein
MTGRPYRAAPIAARGSECPFATGDGSFAHIMSSPPDSKPQGSAPKGAESGSALGRTGKGERAFDAWLKHGLHKLFDDIANEPVPDALLKIIEQDRQK